MELRKAVFAGSWYPDRAAACDEEIEAFLSSDADSPDTDQPQWIAGIVPHAGWYFSGRIACRVINRLKGADPIDLVVVFGMHLHPQSPNYMMTTGAWENVPGRR